MIKAAPYQVEDASGEYAPATALLMPDRVESVSSLLCARIGASVRKSWQELAQQSASAADAIAIYLFIFVMI